MASNKANNTNISMASAQKVSSASDMVICEVPNPKAVSKVTARLDRRRRGGCGRDAQAFLTSVCCHVVGCITQWHRGRCLFYFFLDVTVSWFE